MTPLYLPRWQEVLIAIFKLPETQRYPQRLYRVCPTSSSHAKTIIKTLNRLQLIRIDKTSSRRFLKLTPKAKHLANTCFRFDGFSLRCFGSRTRAKTRRPGVFEHQPDRQMGQSDPFRECARGAQTAAVRERGHGIDKPALLGVEGLSNRTDDLGREQLVFASLPRRETPHLPTVLRHLQRMAG